MNRSLWPVTIFALVTLGVGAAGLSAVVADDEVEKVDPGQSVKRIKMLAENWDWSPDTIRVTRGTRVAIDFESLHASHSFVLKAYKIKVPLPQDKTAHIEFVADRVGEFKWRCGRPCGDGCPKMVGKLIVSEAE